MGKGPKLSATQETSRQGSLSERVMALEDGMAGSEVSPPAPDPCRDDLEITIAIEGAGATVGDALWLTPGAPPHAVTAAGMVGAVQHPEAGRVEACMRVGISFTGVVTSVLPSTIRAVVHGE